MNFLDVFEKLSSFPQLTSLTLIVDFSFSNEQLQFTFKKLKFFSLQSREMPLDLDLLLSSMPNLIELKLNAIDLSKLKLQNTIGIRYLGLPYNFFKNNGDFVYFIKNTPNLIQLTTKENWKFSN